MSEYRFVNVGNTRIRYLRRGEGTPLVLIHGSGGGDLRDWQFSLFDALAKTNDVIAFDRPGIGESDEIDNMTDPFAQARSLKAAAHALGAARPIVVGHSFGGLVALCWGLLGPEDVAGIGAISPVAMPFDEKLPAILNILPKPVIGALIARMACSVLRKKVVEDSALQAFGAMGWPEHYMETTGDILFRNPKEQQNIAREIVGALPRLAEIAAQYKTLTAPVEIVFGTKDENAITKYHARPLAEALPNAKLTLLEGVAHMPHYQAPEAVLNAIARLNANNGASHEKTV